MVKQTEYTLSILLGQNPVEIANTYTLKEQIVPPEVPPGLPSQLLERRPDIREAEQLLAAQNARIGMAQAMRFPSISLTGLLGLGSDDLSTLVSPDAVIWSAGGQLLGPIFNFNKNKRRVDIERHRTEQMLLSYEQTVLIAFKEVEDALVEIRTYKKELEARKRQVTAATNASLLSKARYDISEKTYNSRKEYLTIIQARFDKGTVPQIDLNHAQIQEAQAESAIYLYERMVKQTEYTLSILLGQNPVEIANTYTLKEQIVPPEVPPGLPSQLLERRPDIREAEQLLAAQNARIGMAQAMRFPSISLTGLLGLGSDDLSTLVSPDAVIWSAGGQLLGPIFNFNKNKRRVDIERHRTEQMLLSYEQTVLIAFKEVEDALVEIRTYKKELEARKRQVTAATNASLLSKARYDKGVTSYLEVLESNRQLFDAELIAAQTLDEYLFAYVKLYKALGGGW